MQKKIAEAFRLNLEEVTHHLSTPYMNERGDILVKARQSSNQ